MRSFLYATLVGLVGAGIVHIVVLLLLPSFSERDAWARLSAAAPLYAPTPLDVQGGDPLFRSVACRFDLADGPLHVWAQGQAPFWSASVYDRAGHNLFSVSDRTLAGKLDFLVLDRGQSAATRGAGAPLSSATPVSFQAETEQGIAVLRAFVPDQTWEAEVQALVSSFACATLPTE